MCNWLCFSGIFLGMSGHIKRCQALRKSRMQFRSSSNLRWHPRLTHLRIHKPAMHKLDVQQIKDGNHVCELHGKLTLCYLLA